MLSRVERGGEELLHFGYLVARLACAALPLDVSYRLAERVADVWYVLGRRARRNLAHNLALVPGVKGNPARIRRTSRAVMRNFARMVTEFLYMPKLKGRRLERLVDLKSFAKLRSLPDNTGVILVTAHLGNWELGAAMARMTGIDLHVVVYDHPDERIASLFRRRREAMGLKVMSVKDAARRMRSLAGHASVGEVTVPSRRGTGYSQSLTAFSTLPYCSAIHRSQSRSQRCLRSALNTQLPGSQIVS